jgi:hypothetical protein
MMPPAWNHLLHTDKVSLSYDTLFAVFISSGMPEAKSSVELKLSSTQA